MHSGISSEKNCVRGNYINFIKRTSADASGGTQTGAKVALEPLGMIARLSLAAVFIQLPGAHFAAAAAIKHKTDTRCTLG